MTPPRRDTTQKVPVQTEVCEAIDKKMAKWPAIISILIALIGSIIAAVTWANTSHDQIKSWTLSQISVSNTSVKETVKEQYTPKYEFSAVKQSLEDQKALLEKMDKKLDEVIREKHHQ